jgi:hypothetical protein
MIVNLIHAQKIFDLVIEVLPVLKSTESHSQTHDRDFDLVLRIVESLATVRSSCILVELAQNANKSTKPSNLKAGGRRLAVPAEPDAQIIRFFTALFDTATYVSIGFVVVLLNGMLRLAPCGSMCVISIELAS